MNAKQRRIERRRRDRLGLPNNQVPRWLWPRGTRRVKVHDEIDVTHFSLNRDGSFGLGGREVRSHIEYRPDAMGDVRPRGESIGTGRKLTAADVAASYDAVMAVANTVIGRDNSGRQMRIHVVKFAESKL